MSPSFFMRRLPFVVAVFSLFVAAQIARAQNAEDIQRACLATRVKTAPVIDGQFDDPAWQDKTEYRGFVVPDSGEKAKADSSFRVVYDDRALYLAISLVEPNINQLQTGAHQLDDAEIWHDDVVEIFLQANPRQSAYYHLAVNPSSARYDALDRDPNVDIPWTAQSVIGQGEWTVEIAIPFSSIGAALPGIPSPPDGSLMRFNVCRERRDAATADKPNENSAWSRLTRAFHERADFGFLVFTDYNPVLQSQINDLQAKLAVIQQLAPQQNETELKFLTQRIAQPKNIENEAQFRDGLRLIRDAEADLNRMLEAEQPAKAAVADVVVSHLDPYQSIAKDRAAQLLYYATAKKSESNAVQLSFQQAANEYEHDGFALSSRNGISGLQIVPTDLVGNGGRVLPAQNIQCDVIGYLEPRPEDDFNYGNWNKIPAPDLVEKIRRPLDLKNFESKQIWVTVHSLNAAPGEYRGSIRVSDSKGALLKTIPIQVTVWPLKLPQRPALDFYPFTGVPWGGKSGELWADFLVNHYASTVYMELPTDVTAGDKLIAHQGRDLKDMEAPFDLTGKKIEIGGKQWDHFERLKIIHSRGLKLNFDSGEGILPNAVLPDFISYLKRAGFGYQDFRYKISDEDMAPTFLPMFKAYKAIDPKLRLVFIPAGKWDISAFSPYVDTYMCSYSVTGWKEWLPYFQSEQQRGKRVSIYTNWPSWTGRAPLEQIRQDLNRIWQIGVSEYSAWTANIYPPLNYVYPYGGAAAPMRSVVDLPTERQTTSSLVYFRREGDVFYPVSSKRLEAIRDGITDWMYLKMLDDLLQKKSPATSAAERNRLRTELEKLAAQTPHTRAEFSARKIALAKTIMDLQRQNSK
jgi:hypothetical protein